VVVGVVGVIVGVVVGVMVLLSLCMYGNQPIQRTNRPTDQSTNSTKSTITTQQFKPTNLCTHGREQTRQCHTPGALDVVVEAQGLVAVGLQDGGRVVAAEVFELHQRPWEVVLHRYHELIHHLMLSCWVFGLGVVVKCKELCQVWCGFCGVKCFGFKTA
jgi:hypothetical protein